MAKEVTVNIIGRSRRCRCGYRLYALWHRNGSIGIYGNEQDELGGMQINHCPNCLALLVPDELLSEAEWQAVTRRDDWEVPGSGAAARNVELCGYELVGDAPHDSGGGETFATATRPSSKPSSVVSIAQSQRSVWLGEF